jgi:uncharacterized protein YoxC
LDQSLVNYAVVIALLLLAVTTVWLTVSLGPLISQTIRTLMALERLSDTVDNEVKPTFYEIRETIDGIKQFPRITARQVSEVGHKVEDVASSVSQVVTEAKKNSSIFGAGLLAGLKTYFSSHKDNKEQNGEINQQLTTDEGEKNVK